MEAFSGIEIVYAMSNLHAILWTVFRRGYRWNYLVLSILLLPRQAAPIQNSVTFPSMSKIVIFPGTETGTTR